MQPFEIAIKHTLLTGEISAKDYNHYIVSAVEQKVIKDITPKAIVLENNQEVHAIIELSDGSKFEIQIWKTAEFDAEKNNFSRKSEVKQLPLTYFMGSKN